jgi:hypothetical protein
MKSPFGRHCLGFSLLVWIAGAVLAFGVDESRLPSAGDAVISSAQIEADWLLQDEVRGLPSLQSSPEPSPQEDAAGACDGKKDGLWGFHTDCDENPWWQVDLGSPRNLTHALIYNRCDTVANRAARLAVLVSSDGSQWKQVYQHDGTVFYGQTDGKPLRVPLDVNARWLRVQLPGKSYLHLDEVEVYADGGNDNLALGKPANQSSKSAWSTVSTCVSGSASPRHEYPIAGVVERGIRLAEDLHARGVNVEVHAAKLRRIQAELDRLTKDAPEEVRRQRYLEARWAVRAMALANPLLDFNDLLFVKRVPGEFNHMSDQYYGWFSRPGGGLYLLSLRDSRIR